MNYWLSRQRVFYYREVLKRPTISCRKRLFIINSGYFAIRTTPLRFCASLRPRSDSSALGSSRPLYSRKNLFQIFGHTNRPAPCA